jgi:tRNA threonylcarbamoyladenosine modification (KEOPS) complex  Pcc1 subunit
MRNTRPSPKSRLQTQLYAYTSTIRVEDSTKTVYTILTTQVDSSFTTRAKVSCSKQSTSSVDVVEILIQAVDIGSFSAMTGAVLKVLSIHTQLQQLPITKLTTQSN